MTSTGAFPTFDGTLPELNQFILGLVKDYEAGKIESWEDLEQRVNAYFTPERMEQMESVVPGWRKMASYSGGITLIHVMCVFLGLYIMPEFLRMTKAQQQMMKWIILLHDIEKEPRPGRRDHGHAFRSAAAAARLLPKLRFAVTPEYDPLVEVWAEYTRSAVTKSDHSTGYIQDNHKLPKILDGITKLFGHDTAASLIIKTILFHLSVDMKAWPPAAPLTDKEVMLYFDSELIGLLKVMNLADSEGWNMFGQSREFLRNDTLESFKNVEQLMIRAAENE
jgi:hypothetical protein